MITIVSDTTSGLSLPEAAKLGVPFLPQIIVFGDETYRDDTEMDNKAFMAKLRTSTVLPKTAAPPPALYNPIYQAAGERGDTVIVICPSTDLSGTYRSATVAAQDFPEVDIRVIDSRGVAANLGSLVRQAIEWANEGMDADTLVESIKEMGSRARLFFYVDTLEYLAKGGRIGKAQALMGGILQVKPILLCKDGIIQPFETTRTKKRALARLKELIYTDCPRTPDAHLAIQHTEAEEDALALAAEFKEEFGFHNIPIINLPPAIIVHAGPGAVVVSFFAPKDSSL